MYCGTTIVRIRTVLKQHPFRMPVTQGLVKRGASSKHTAHIFDRRGVPHVQRLVKGFTSFKHTSHVGDRWGVPVWNRFIELTIMVKQHRHVGDQRSVPGSNGTMTTIVVYIIVFHCLSQCIVSLRLKTCGHCCCCCFIICIFFLSMFVCLLFTLRNSGHSLRYNNTLDPDIQQTPRGEHASYPGAGKTRCIPQTCSSWW